MAHAAGTSWVPGPCDLPCTPYSHPSLQVSAGSPYPATAKLAVRAPPSGTAGFLSIERLNPKPPRIGDTLNLNLRAVGITGASFSHYYYLVCMN